MTQPPTPKWQCKSCGKTRHRKNRIYTGYCVDCLMLAQIQLTAAIFDGDKRRIRQYQHLCWEMLPL